jgi:hypothetical protein
LYVFSSNNTAFAQQQRQLQTLNPTQDITMTNATNTLSLSGTATTTIKPDTTIRLPTQSIVNKMS